jgi:hypothetical protein
MMDWQNDGGPLPTWYGQTKLEQIEQIPWTEMLPIYTKIQKVVEI